MFPEERNALWLVRSLRHRNPRSAPANDTDLALIREMAELAVRCALEGRPGVVGHDEDRGDELRAIEFERIAGHKPFDATQGWFTELLAGTGQA